MITKVYDKIKQILKNNQKFLLFLLILFILCSFPLPYYIDAPGGLIDVSKRIEIENSYEVKGSFNLAYVTELKATIPTLFLSLINKDWDVLKKEEIISSNETIEEMEYRNHIMLEEANQNALYIGFSKANKYVSITNQKVYVVYLNDSSHTDLKIGDQIIKVEGKEVSSKQDVLEALSEYETNDTVHFTVLKDNQETIKTAILYEENDKLMVGMVLSELKELDTNEQIEFHFKKSESGPSGGFMMALSIYNYLIEEDITHGLKIVGTGTIDEKGNVGAIGGIEYKIKAAVKQKADLFFVPEDNYEEALKVVEENHLTIPLIKVSHIDEAIDYLQNDI